jgi:D-alanyl-D-alanine carboxypeptidase
VRLAVLGALALALAAIGPPSAASPATLSGTASPGRAEPTASRLVTPRKPTPTASTTPEVTSVTVTQQTFAQDTLVDPVVTGRVSGAGGVLVEAQRWVDGAWAAASATVADADGAYTLTLTQGHGQIRADRWRIVARGAASADINVDRTAVLNPVVHTPTRAEVQYSWREGCPVSYTLLRVVDANHYYGFDHLMHRGSIVVRNTVVAQFEGLLQKTVEVRFPIRRMQPVDAYKAVDEDSAADDNTSAFNCRLTTLGSEWSEHAYGVAIDLDPVENPYDNGGVMVPTNGGTYLNRSDVRAGMLTPGSPVIAYAVANGWTWLAPTDYQHLEWP